MSDFAKRLVLWQRQHGRHDLPWQHSRDPYPIWVSEIMLQQTQVATVIPYFQRFMARFPDLQALASAPEEAVLAAWSGLGYYARARNLQRAAQHIVATLGGVFPREPEAIAQLPGVGRSTAAAIAVFAFGARAAILDGNVKRVLARHAGIEGWPGDKAVAGRLWQLAEARLPPAEIEAYTQGLMDLGSGVCTRRAPRCGDCPVAADCFARRENRVASLPAPRPRKPVPERQTTWLILLHGDTVLLERRPPTGLWAGLWCLPEVEVNHDPREAARIRYGLGARGCRALPSFSHGFTHFRLLIHPRLMRVSAPPTRAEEPGLLWLPLIEAGQAALPAPVKKVLAHLSVLGKPA